MAQTSPPSGPQQLVPQKGQQQRAAQKKRNAAQPASSKPAANPKAAAAAPPKREAKGFMETIMEGPRLTTTPPEAADWVRQSRADPGAARRGRSSRARPWPADAGPDPGEGGRTRSRARPSRQDRRPQASGWKAGSAAGKPETPETEKAKWAAF